MYPIGICTGHPGSLAGVDFIEENVQGYLQPEQAQFTPAARTLPTRAANCFLPGALKCVGPEVDLNDAPKELQKLGPASEVRSDAGEPPAEVDRRLPDG